MEVKLIRCCKLAQNNTSNNSEKMAFINIPTEQTTAATDLILAVISLITAFGLNNLGKQVQPVKTRIWVVVFLLLTIGALFGTAAHGFEMSAKMNYFLWQPLNLALGLSVSLFAAGALFDLRNGTISKKIILGLLILGVIFYFITVFIPGSFLVFIIYEAVVMIFALIAYIILALQKRLRGAWWMVLGILITIIAAVIQSTDTVTVEFIWVFDHNGIFHVIQMAGVLIIYLGLAKSFHPVASEQ